jgi:hypothetical protein
MRVSVHARLRALLGVIKEGLNTPTAVEPVGDTIWIAERGAGKAVSIPMPKWRSSRRGRLVRRASEQFTAVTKRD